MTQLRVFFSILLFSIAASALAYGIVQYVPAARKLAHALTATYLPRWGDSLCGALVCVYSASLIGLGTLSYYALSVSNTDLAQYQQLVWNSLNGRLLENTFIPDAPMFLGKSFTPILLAFVPLYSAWSSPLVLIIIQSLAVGLAAFPIYWLARARLGHLLAITIVAAYFLSASLQNAALDEFHEIVLAIPLLAYAVFFLLRKKYKPLLVCLGVLLLVKEEIAFLVIMFGIYIAVAQKKRALGAGIAFFGALSAVLLLQVFIPYFRGAPAGDFYYFGSGWSAGGGDRYGYLGGNLLEIVVTILTRPDLVLQNLFVPAKIEFVFFLLLPLAFVSLLGIEVLALAAPTFGYSLLSNYGWQYSILTAYPAPILPFVYLSAVVGLARGLRWRQPNPDARFISVSRQAAIAALIFASSAANYYLFARGPLTKNFSSEKYSVSERSRDGLRLLETIPPDAVVVAQNEFLAPLASRARVYEIPLIPDYRQTDYFFADTTKGYFNVHRSFWEKYLTSGYFQVVAHDGFLLGKRRAPDQPAQIRFGEQLIFLGHALTPEGPYRGDMVLRPVLLWRAAKPITRKIKFVVQIVDARGHVWAKEEREPQEGALPTTAWQAGTPVGDQFVLNLYPTLPRGNYFLTLAACEIGAEDCLEARAESENRLNSEIVLQTFFVEKNKNDFVASDLPIENRHWVDMGEVRLLGFASIRESLSPGELLQVGLYWRAREKPRGDYLVAVQLRDAAGRVAFEHSARPAADAYPTTQWDAGEVLLDWHDFEILPSLPLENYTIYVLLKEVTSSRIAGESKLSAVRVVR